MASFLKKIENWLDDKNDHLDRKNYCLKFSKNWFHRLVWRLVFKPKKGDLSLFNGSPCSISVKAPKANKVIHVVNLINPDLLQNKDLANRVRITLQSIRLAQRNNTTLLGVVTDDFDTTVAGFSNHNWKFKKISRNATSIGSKIRFAFLRDMFSAALDLANDGDIIFYSNMDCPIHPKVYQNLLGENFDAVEYIRKDIPCPKDYSDIFFLPFEHYDIGVDGLAFKKESLIEFLKLFPDFIIGEPHWDTAASGILHKNFNVVQNLSDLYHIKHPQQWDDNNLTEAGKYNKKLYKDCINYGLMYDKLISIKRDCIILLNTEDAEVSHLITDLKKISRNSNTVLYSEFSKNIGRFKKLLTGLGYLPIHAKSEYVSHLNQVSTISNMLAKRFFDHSSIIILLPSCNNIDSELINKIKINLKENPIIKEQNYLAINPSKTIDIDRFFDFYVDNSKQFDNIDKYSFINDEGLLELFKNYGHFQSANLPIEISKK